eukprot:CAMPEP_0173394220 /NCGR_PEP_ID=MMETSP1356-20130122/25779_1 /TAXON_ID=77927 ORGANISM="Hemiselmis virescens, Strain PCC157" /NCGR_SAMPLE_ID=MMETSP1356 /ASSEMBLY_ACC=CAM_ASM_000847 /LENGTH=637 /DNA_ID=CAMNT_0014352465 /DNA_START=71 /DNA_END=1984 /DNA_ORIENTATION=-
MSEALAAQVAELSRQLNEQRVELDRTHKDVTSSWLVLCGALVLFMQTGFAMLETGVVSKQNVISVMFKNILDSSVTAVTFWLVGYAFAYGKDWRGFIGTDHFGSINLVTEVRNAAWFFKWTFAGASATIVSGAVCERIRIRSYMAFTFWMGTAIYPVVAHWCWGGGFLSYDREGNGGDYTFAENGVLDFAGSGVVHLVGGVAALTGAASLGPRLGRFEPGPSGQLKEFEGHNMTLVLLGAGVLVFGWFGFNCGSVLEVENNGHIISLVAVNTTIAFSVGCVSGLGISLLFDGRFELSIVINCMLAALVSVNASVDFLQQWAVAIVAFVGAGVFFAFRTLLRRLRIDDPLEASAVHGAAGAWGLLAAGIFCTDENVRPEYDPGMPPHTINNACSNGTQFGVQVVGVVCIIVWTGFMSMLAWGSMQLMGVLRVPVEWEEIGMDALEHGATAFGVRDPTVGLMLETGGMHHGTNLYEHDRWLRAKSGGPYTAHQVAAAAAAGIDISEHGPRAVDLSGKSNTGAWARSGDTAASSPHKTFQNFPTHGDVHIQQLPQQQPVVIGHQHQQQQQPQQQQPLQQQHQQQHLPQQQHPAGGGMLQLRPQQLPTNSWSPRGQVSSPVFPGHPGPGQHMGGYPHQTHL